MSRKKARRWRPKNGTQFWFIKGDLNLDQRDEYLIIDYDYYEDWMSFNNCFRTEKEAQAALARIKKVMRG